MSVLINQIKWELSTPRNDNVLHFSQHLQHDRHTAIYMKYGYPHRILPWNNIFPLMQGTGVHETMHTIMNRIVDEYRYECPILVENQPDLKYPWAGTIDAVVEYDTSDWIFDYKTISGAGMSFIDDAPKPDHVLQVSAYKAFMPAWGEGKDYRTAIIYLPSSPDYKRVWQEPRMVEFEALTKDNMLARMRNVERAISVYADTGELPKAPEGEYTWKKKYKFWQLVYKPHYTSLFCPWRDMDDDPCGCSAASYKVIAEWKKGHLTIEDGYDTIVEEKGLPDEVLEEV